MVGTAGRHSRNAAYDARLASRFTMRKHAAIEQLTAVATLRRARSDA
jgi:hypothetical protein